MKRLKMDKLMIFSGISYDPRSWAQCGCFLAILKLIMYYKWCFEEKMLKSTKRAVLTPLPIAIFQFLLEKPVKNPEKLQK